MSVGSISGSVSFWQQDQNYWAQAQQNDQTQTASSTLIGNMFGASSTLSNGLSSLANQTALTRVNNALTAAVQSALSTINGGSSSSDSSSSSSTSGSSSSSGSSAPESGNAGSSVSLTAPATGTGTAPLTTGTSLYTLGMLKSGSVTITDGTNTTVYNSTGSDTVGDLINYINSGKYGNAAVTASLNAKGDLVLTANNTTATIYVGGAYAPNIGFTANNDSFSPTTAPSAANSSGSSGTSSTSSSSSSSSSGSSSSSSSSTSTGSSGSSSSTGSTTTSSGIPKNSAIALLSSSTAETLLSSSGLTGNILDMLA